MPRRPTDRAVQYSQTVAVSGHMVDHPQRPIARFPADAELGVSRAVRDAFRRWDVGAGTLVVCGGARGTDIIAGEQALLCGAEVWLLLALPEAEFGESSVRLPGSDWEERFMRLRRRCPTWSLAEEVGPPADGEDVYECQNEWCLTIAEAQAPPGRARALAVWDGRSGDGPGGTADFVARARGRGIDVHIIEPIGRS